MKVWDDPGSYAWLRGWEPQMSLVPPGLHAGVTLLCSGNPTGDHSPQLPAAGARVWALSQPLDLQIPRPEEPARGQTVVEAGP